MTPEQIAIGGLIFLGGMWLLLLWGVKLDERNDPYGKRHG